MKADTSFTTSFRVAAPPNKVFDAINQVSNWWTGKIDGPTDRVGAVFEYRYEDIHRSTQKVMELVPGKKVVWQVTDASLNSFDDKTEWNGTKMEFAIAPAGDETEVRFTHHGLVPSCQCYGDCSDAWTQLVTDSLKHFISSRG